MSFDQSNLGKFFIKENDYNTIFIVTGYDYLEDKYILKDYNGNLNHLSNKDIYKILNYNETKKSLEDNLNNFHDGIFKYSYYMNYYNKKTSKERLEFYRIFRRLRENAEAIEKFREKKSYEDVVHQSTKGFRRALKRLYRYVFNTNDYYDIVELLETVKYNSLSIEVELTKYSQVKKMLEILEEMNKKYSSTK